METENEHAQDDVVEQEDTTSQEDTTDSDSQDEEVVTIPKSKFKSLDRKARAYDAEKDNGSKASKFTTTPDAKWKQKIELGVKGYDDGETDFILKNGGVKALEDPFVVSAIETMREKKKAERATLENEGQKSSIDKRFTPEAFAKLPHEEQLKVASEL